MSKIALAMIALLLMTGSALALDMEAKSFYAFGTFSLPSGDFGDFAGNGFGGGVGIEVPHNEQINFRGEIGYIKFGGQDLDFGTYTYSYDYSMIPILALAEYHFDPDTPFYGLGGVGIYMLRYDATYDGPTGGFNVDLDGSTSEFGFTAGGGYAVNEKINIEGRFNIISNSNQITVSGTYGF